MTAVYKLAFGVFATFLVFQIASLRGQAEIKQPSLIEKILTPPSLPEKTPEKNSVSDEEFPTPPYVRRRSREEIRKNERITEELEAQNELMERARSPHGCETFQKIDPDTLEEIGKPRTVCN
jgi:hypothetical protein